MSDPRLAHPITQLATFRELTPAERQAVHEHLAVCAECGERFEAFRKQDALLAALPERAPRRMRWAEQATSKGGSSFWNGVARLGDVMAVGGLATLTLAIALLVRAAATAPTQPGSAPPAPNVPLTLPPDLPALVNPWVLAAPWIGGAFVAVGALFALGKRSRIWPGLGLVFSLVLLFGFVPPLTALPNPVGLAWRIAGEYAYDPRLPFKNVFVVSGDPTGTLRPRLDRLLGQTGLDPLDPARPLARYAFERVSLPRDKSVALVSTRFIYADGSSRVYEVPLTDPVPGVFGFYLFGWQNDGLARLRTEHLALPGQPFADSSSPIRLGDAARLPLSPQADQLDAVNPNHWLWLSNRLQRLVWSPQADAFLMTEQRPDHTRQLWLVPLDGSPPQPVNRGGSVYEYGWSPDGALVVYTSPGELQASSSARNESTQLVVARRDALNQPVIRRAVTNASLPGLNPQGIWYAQDGALWLMDYATGNATRVTGLSGLGSVAPSLPTFWPVAVSPDASRVAFACGNDLCLMNLDGSERRVIPATGIRAIAWDRTGAWLAAVSLDQNNLGPVRMLVVSRDGRLQQDVAIAPRDATDPPQWTPDSQIVFVQTYPMDGRRIITVNAETGQALDQSREHWDAYFALSPDGKNVLLNNGRGGFWLAPVLR